MASGKSRMVFVATVTWEEKSESKHYDGICGRTHTVSNIVLRKTLDDVSAIIRSEMAALEEYLQDPLAKPTDVVINVRFESINWSY